MQNDKTLETVERATLLNKVAWLFVALNIINLKNRDPCYGNRFLYLRI